MSAKPETDNKTISQIEWFRQSMLSWYDEHQRVLPWRARAGQVRIPYKTWLSEVMLQQTTVNAVIPYFNKFVDKWPDVYALADAGEEEIMDSWAGLGYYSRARNLHKCAKLIVSEYGGEFPSELKELKSLPGVGDYISAAVRSIAFDKQACVVDGNVERVLSRFYAVKQPLPKSKKRLKNIAAKLSDNREDRPGDFAQAMMDLGATICTPKSPKCFICPLSSDCKARIEGLQADLPYKEKKKVQPQKYGNVYWVESRCGSILLQRRPDDMMLGRMIGFPTNVWQPSKVQGKQHMDMLEKYIGSAQQLPHVVKHSFTHFDIHLNCFKIVVDKDSIQLCENEGFYWMKCDELLNTNFPTLFKKFYKFML